MIYMEYDPDSAGTRISFVVKDTCDNSIPQGVAHALFEGLDGQFFTEGPHRARAPQTTLNLFKVDLLLHAARCEQRDADIRQQKRDFEAKYGKEPPRDYK